LFGVFYLKRLFGKTCLITGAAGGIGKAIAELFHSEDALVILSDIADESGSKIANDLGTDATYIHLDVSKENDWITAFEYIKEKFCKLDILVNNAGIGGFTQTKGPHNAENFDLESWHKVMAVNSDGVALGCKYAIQLMKSNKSGSIVNISSRSGLVGIPHMVAYAASKAAARNHTKSVALYCAEMQYNIRCNSIHPGAILTPMWDPMLGKGIDRENMIEKISSEIPLGKMGTALDVAYAALYLASDESTYVTGVELNIDGGILAGSTATPEEL
jgi:NAD(P)-dependent dehydrogenase (short-subunit alcohol dehydrogenase family)